MVAVAAECSNDYGGNMIYQTTVSLIYRHPEEMMLEKYILEPEAHCADVSEPGRAFQK